MKNVYAGIFENSIKLFKKHYRYASEKRKNATHEILVQISTKTMSASVASQKVFGILKKKSSVE